MQLANSTSSLPSHKISTAHRVKNIGEGEGGWWVGGVEEKEVEEEKVVKA